MGAADNCESCPICGADRPTVLPMNLRGGITSDERYIPGASPVWQFCPNCGGMTARGETLNPETFYRDDYAFLLESAEIEPAIDQSQKKYSEVLADFYLPHIRKRDEVFLFHSFRSDRSRIEGSPCPESVEITSGISR